MGKQRIIKDELWSDDWVYDLDPSEKLLWVFLLTNERCNILGIYKISTSWISSMIGIEKKKTEIMLDRFEHDGKILQVQSYIIIVNFVKNQSHNPSVIAGMQRILDSLPEAVIQAVTGCIQAGTYLTLLNLTLPNSTLLNSPDGDFDKQEDSMGKQVQGVIKLRRSLKWPTPFGGAKDEPKWAQHLVRDHGYKDVTAVMKWYNSHRHDDYMPSVGGLDDLYRKFLTIKTKMGKDNDDEFEEKLKRARRFV